MAHLRGLLIRFEPSIVAGLVVAYFVLYSVLSVFRHETYHSFAHPGRLAHILFQGPKLKFLVGIFGPVLGLTAISGYAAILVLPTLAILLLSNYAPEYAFTSHYSAPLIALEIGTSILGFARLRRSPVFAALRPARVPIGTALRGICPQSGPHPARRQRRV